MGVDRTDYLMLAVDVGYSAFNWDKHGAESEGAPGRLFDIVLDGMCGKYCLAGKIIAKSEPYRGDEGFEMVKINQEKLGVDRAALAATVSKSFWRKISADDFSLVLFSHFS